jgi:hypothetical protein
MNFANEHHFALSIVAALVCNGWVLYLLFIEYMRGIQAQIAAANARLRTKAMFDEFIETDKTEEEYGVSQSSHT